MISQTCDCAAAQVIELIVTLERAATMMMKETGRRPVTMTVGKDVAAQIRQVSEDFPAVFRSATRPHIRPAGFPNSENWLGHLSGIEIFESAIPTAEASV